MELGLLDRDRAIAYATGDLDSSSLFAAARQIRDDQFGDIVTYSRKVFVPLTTLCRDTCTYCTFVKPPGAGGEYLEPSEVLAIVRAGERFGCTEALFTLGDRPEDKWPQARVFLESQGAASTLEYVRQVAELVVAETRLFPHANPGLMGVDDLEALRPSNISAGLMLENISPRLMEPGMPHHNCPDKDPELRSATIRAAAAARVPFTTGVLVGIGETTEELVDSLYALADLDEGQVQEVIVQNFRAKADTRMRRDPEPPAEFFKRIVALTRLIVRPEVTVQVPPNLSERYEDLLDAGVNDWGGVSPVTIDWVNPEQPWPHLDELAARTSAAGFKLTPRLPTHPGWLSPEWVDHDLLKRARSVTDEQGYAVIPHDHVPTP